MNKIQDSVKFFLLILVILNNCEAGKDYKEFLCPAKKYEIKGNKFESKPGIVVAKGEQQYYLILESDLKKAKEYISSGGIKEKDFNINNISLAFENLSIDKTLLSNPKANGILQHLEACSSKSESLLNLANENLILNYNTMKNEKCSTQYAAKKTPLTVFENSFTIGNLFCVFKYFSLAP